MASRIQAVEQDIEGAADSGALHCAPRELALSRAHLGFAEAELRRGHRARAEEHLAIAAPNAEAALLLSPRERCANAGAGETSGGEGAAGEGDESGGAGAASVLGTDGADGDQDGDGIRDAFDACPTRAEDMDGDQDEDGCPDSDDRDSDGVLNADDGCPDTPEDLDEYEDEDGCPEADNDGDGIADLADSCPLDPEDIDSHQDEDGCPDPDNDEDGAPDVLDPCPLVAGPEGAACPTLYPGVEVRERDLRLQRRLEFMDDGTVAPSSLPLLMSVVAALRERPGMTIEIGAHTDSSGTDAENIQSSQARAERVREVLVEQGHISPQRVRARGYGEARPLESNSTEEGRQANRRIEIQRTDVGETEGAR